MDWLCRSFLKLGVQPESSEFFCWKELGLLLKTVYGTANAVQTSFVGARRQLAAGRPPQDTIWIQAGSIEKRKP